MVKSLGALQPWLFLMFYLFYLFYLFPAFENRIDNNSQLEYAFL